MSTPVILVCPCCASPLDATSSLLEQQLVCGTCAQTWSMVVDADRQAHYSLT